MRKRSMFAIGIAAAGVGSVAAAAGSVGAASAHSGYVTHHFTARTSAPTELLGLDPSGAPRPDACNPVTGKCLIGFIGHDQFEGDLVGNQFNVGTLPIGLGTFTGHAISLATFDGTVAACGASGTVVIGYDVELGVEPGRNEGTFEIVSGSGTGGLEELRGRGTLVAHPQADGTIQSEADAKLRC